MQIVIVSNDPRTDDLGPVLLEDGLLSQRCRTVAEASELAELYPIDLILLEAEASGVDAAALRRFHAAHATVPSVVFGSGFDASSTIALLADGADDVFESSLAPAMMTARIRAIVRRARGCKGAAVTLGPLRFDMIRRSLSCDGTPVSLTGREYRILEILLTRRGCMLSKEALLDQVYGSADAPMVRIIDVYVCRLRKKLAEHGVHDVIETVRGLGYMIAEETASSGRGRGGRAPEPWMRLADAA